MADMSDKFSAIWKALDEMSAKDPAAYQAFIKEQLEEGEKLFGKGKTDKVPGTTPKATATTSSGGGDGFNLIAGLQNLSLLTGTNHSSKPGESSKNCEKKSSISSIDKDSSKQKKSGLLDDEIGENLSSIITSIVKKEMKDEDDPCEEIDLQEIRLAPQTTDKGKKKKLIEEI